MQAFPHCHRVESLGLLAAGTGAAGIKYSPKGLAVPPLGNWGNLRYSANAAFMMLIHAGYTKDATVKRNCIEWAQGQIDYMLGLPNRWACAASLPAAGTEGSVGLPPMVGLACCACAAAAQGYQAIL
jgi:hypothetical protein